MSTGITMGGSGPSPIPRSSSRVWTIDGVGKGAVAVGVAVMGKCSAISSLSEGWKTYMATMDAPKNTRPATTKATVTCWSCSLILPQGTLLIRRQLRDVREFFAAAQRRQEGYQGVDLVLRQFQGLQNRIDVVVLSTALVVEAHDIFQGGEDSVVHVWGGTGGFEQ